MYIKLYECLNGSKDHFIFKKTLQTYRCRERGIEAGQLDLFGFLINAIVFTFVHHHLQRSTNKRLLLHYKP